ncbi:DUF397 domain-containing protein [Streptomyces mayonensis]|uniref:DUF397 domain-containing protein n=1 Tax=Streptomyces mayonensis TaxID=2750816 RepID=UPI001C1E3D3B|nr:DUF397 domain-containing protein [Streptomyces sp. A108]MBU6534160.1 DUF397 domain-containing protein [Streptomyces sp. A108]
MAKVIGPFRKSSHSGAESNCVEVAPTHGNGRAVRDSKRQDGPLLIVSREGWQAFLGQFASAHGAGQVVSPGSW